MYHSHALFPWMWAETIGIGIYLSHLDQILQLHTAKAIMQEVKIQILKENPVKDVVVLVLVVKVAYPEERVQIQEWDCTPDFIIW